MFAVVCVSMCRCSLFVVRCLLSVGYAWFLFLDCCCELYVVCCCVMIVVCCLLCVFVCYGFLLIVKGCPLCVVYCRSSSLFLCVSC